MRDAAGQIADRLHLLRLLQRLLGMDAIGDVDSLRHDRHDVSRIIFHRAEREIEHARADGQIEGHAQVLRIARGSALYCRFHALGQPWRGDEPRRLPIRMPDDVFEPGADAGKRGAVCVEQRAVRRHQTLIEMRGLEYCTNVLLALRERGGAFGDALLEAFVQFVHFGDVGARADEAQETAVGGEAGNGVFIEHAPGAVVAAATELDPHRSVLLV